ncbi:MAG: ferritin-like domain-containing protein [Clostridia bacterium]|nr:ferritin-like domain-containing protein [Clostridia bacterium]
MARDKFIMEFSLALPYPELSGKITNDELIELYDLYAGRFSELTAVTTYSYQSVIVNDCNLSTIFEKIAESEMVHLSKLAKAIFFFGGAPVYAGKYNYFSGSYADYESDLKQIILNNAQGERQAIYAYKQLATRTQNQSLCELLSRIAMDEELHLNLLEKIYNEINICE